MITDRAHLKIRKLREERDLTQSEMAEELGIGRTTYVNFESGKTRLFSQTLSKFAAFMGVSEEEIAFNRPELLEAKNASEEKIAQLRLNYESLLSAEKERNTLLQEENSDLKTRLKRAEDLNDYLLAQVNREK